MSCNILKKQCLISHRCRLQRSTCSSK